MESEYLAARSALEADCANIGVQFVSQLRQRTHGTNMDVIGIPIAIAAVLDQVGTGNGVDIISFYLEAAVKRYVGTRLERYAEGIEALCNRLFQIGAVNAHSKCNNGGDNYVYTLPATHFWRNILICETQNRFFVVLMNWGPKPKYHPAQYREALLREQSDMSHSDLAGYMEFLRPRIHVIQEPWTKGGLLKMEQYAQLPDNQLPSWTDDRKLLHGYVASLRDGEVDGAIQHYSSICYCLYSLASFIECRDELEVG